MTRSAWLSIGVMVTAFVHPWSAAAQTITGTVTDSSGAILPGVTVEAFSPALIEGSRSVATNEAGRYAIVNLPPGDYTMAFALAGFAGAKRDGVLLTSDFTATVNVQLGVGGVAETVTVGAAAQMVDVQSIATPRVMTRDIMDALPTTRTLAGMAALIPGAGTSGFGAISYRGNADSLVTVDGMRTTFMTIAGPAQSGGFSNEMMQEVSYSTGIESAEMGQPGLRINVVPRDGGNEFRGTLFATYTRESWIAANVDEPLAAIGLRQAKTLKLWDVNPSFGGPLMRGKLWFQLTGRHNGSDSTVLDSFADADPSSFRYVRDESRPTINSTWTGQGSGRLTWQATSKDKLTGIYDRQYAETPNFFSPLFFAALTPMQATLSGKTDLQQNVAVRWTRSHSARLLFEAGFSSYKFHLFYDYKDDVAGWAARFNDGGGDRSLPPAAYAVSELNTGQQLGVSPLSDANVSDTITFTPAMTYVTGTHNLRAGMNFFRGSYYRPATAVGFATFRLAGGVPERVTLTLPTNERDNIDADIGLYVQDRWTIRRLTMNLGVRLDVLKSSVPDQVVPDSPWLAETRFPGKDVLDWKDVSPRLGAAYDLFGTGRTALKAGFARFVAGETVNLTGLANPVGQLAGTDNRTWTDLNNDLTIYNPDGSVQFNELGPTGNRNFGRPIPTTTYDPEVLSGWFHRGYSWELDAGVQHQLIGRVSVTGTYFRRWAGNQRATDNLLVDNGSYSDPFCVTAPVDPRLPGGGGYQVCGLHDIQPSSFGQSQGFNTFATNLGTGRGIIDRTQGYELNVLARFADGAFVQGGVAFRSTLSDNCDIFVDTPQKLYCRTETPYGADVKLNGAYTLPWKIQTAGTYQMLRGPGVTATWNAPASLVAQSLGRPLSGGVATKAVTLIDPQQTFFPYTHQFNLRFSRAFGSTRYRITPMADFYNIFNANGATAVNTTYSLPGPASAWQRPTGILAPRQFRLGAQLQF